MYTAHPSTPKPGKAILFLPDVIGIWANSKLMADQLAANGYHTLLVDLFNGDPMSLNRPADFDFMAWMTKGSDGNNPHMVPQVDKIVAAAVAHLQGQGYTDIGAVGYCFGAKSVVRFMSEAKGRAIKVGYSAHPTNVAEDELAAIKGPFSISAAETDPIFPVENRHKSEAVLKETGQAYQINLFSGVSHGFAVRADLADRQASWAREQAFEQAVKWFDFHL